MKVSEHTAMYPEALVTKLRLEFNQLQKTIEMIPKGRRSSLAITNLEQAFMWAIKAATIEEE